MVLGLTAVGVLGCIEPDSPVMLPGQNCLACHNANGQASDKVWSIGGTVFSDDTADAGVQGAEIVVTDSAGQVLTLASNGAGNFYTAEPVTLPLTAVAVGYNGVFTSMPPSAFQGGAGSPPVTGACNYCHNVNGYAGAGIYPATTGPTAP